MAKSFYEFLIEKVDEDSPVGDLAQDVRRDSGVDPSIGVARLRAHLRSKLACWEALEALKEAAAEYRKSKMASPAAMKRRA